MLPFYCNKVKEWIQNLGLGEHTSVVQDDDEADDESVPIPHEESVSSRNRSFHALYP